MPQRPFIARALPFLLGAVFLGFAPAPAKSTGLDAALVTRSWRVAEGLPQDSVWAIAQTQDGYLWVGTGAGLARFDGVQFKAFGLTEGLPALSVRALLVDRSGALWVGTANGLVRLHQGNVQRFTTKDGLIGVSITSLMEDGEGSVWVGTSQGVNRWHAGKFDVADTSDPSLLVLAVDATGAVCVAGSSGELRRWNGQRFETISEIPQILDGRPNRFPTDASGRMWIAGNGWVHALSGTNWQSYGPQHGLPQAPILCITTSPDGSVWAGSEDQGLYRLNPGAGSFVRINAFNRDLDSIRAFHQDTEGNLWIGTRGAGLTCLRPATVAIWEIQHDGTQGLPFAMTEIDDSLVVSSVGRGLYRVRDGAEPEPFLREELGPFGLRTGVVFADREKNLWLGAGIRLLLVQDGNVREILARGGATSICQDTEGTVWIGNSDGVLRKFRNGLLENSGVTLPRTIVTSLAADPGGGVWAGTYGHGVLHIDREKTVSFGKDQGLANDLIRALYCDPAGVLWVGTEGGGLSRIHQERIHVFTKLQGLPSETIVQILEDEDGYLWLGSYRGIIRVSRHQLEGVASGRLQRVQTRLFGRPDGMRSEQCMSAFGGAVKLRDGRLCFATGDGVVVIDPKQHLKGSPPPRVRIEDILADRQAVKLAASWISALDQREAVVKPLIIGPGRKRLQIDYTAPSFAAPEQVRFRYRLIGLDEEWVEAGVSRSAEYSYLPPGKYRFELTAHSGTGAWADPPLGVNLVFRPFFWQTTWFKAGSAAALVGLAVLLVRALERRRARAQMRRLELETAMERERSRIARDIHDDLGSRLTKISMITDRVIRETSPGNTLSNHLLSISQTARDMLDRLDETVWVVNPRNDQLDRLCDYLLNYAQDFFQHTAIRCRFRVADDPPPLPVAAETRHHVFLIVKEALNNVVCHSGATEVRIQVNFSENKLSLSILDNGRGFDTAACMALGRGLDNMRSRAESIGGRFDLQSAPGHGTTVRMEFEIVRAITGSPLGANSSRNGMQR